MTVTYVMVTVKYVMVTVTYVMVTVTYVMVTKVSKQRTGMGTAFPMSLLCRPILQDCNV